MPKRGAVCFLEGLAGLACSIEALIYGADRYLASNNALL